MVFFYEELNLLNFEVTEESYVSGTVYIEKTNNQISDIDTDHLEWYDYHGNDLKDISEDHISILKVLILKDLGINCFLCQQKREPDATTES